MLEGITVAQAGPWVAFLTLTIAVVTAVYTGKLIPSSWVEQRIQDLNRLSDAKDVRLDEQADYIEVLKENNALYREQGRETTRVVRSLPAPNAPVNVEGS